MTTEAAMVHQDPFIYGYKDYNYNNNGGGYGFPFEEDSPNPQNLDTNVGYWDSPPPPSLAHAAASASASSPETSGKSSAGRRKRRRVKPTKNKEEMENQRMTHIAVERNRRRQMNDYLAVLRSIMPPSYAQRGDQASIVGGAINFVKELEQLHQFLDANNPMTNQQQPNDNVFSNLFTFPQYSTSPSTSAADGAAERRSTVADIEVMMVDSHANIKLSTKRRPKQILKLVAGFQSIGFTILHLNITTVDQCVLYSFSIKVEDECELTTVNDIATTVHNIVEMIQEESICS